MARIMTFGACNGFADIQRRIPVYASPDRFANTMAMVDLQRGDLSGDRCAAAPVVYGGREVLLAGPGCTRWAPVSHGPHRSAAETRSCAARCLPYIAALMSLAMLACLPAAGTTYTVRGTVTYQVNGPTSNGVPNEGSFTVKSDGNVWEVHVHVPEWTNINDFFFQYDGSNLLSFAGMPATPTGQSATGILEAQPVPQVWTASGGEYVWLAYASGAYFKSLTNAGALSLSPIRYSDGRVAREVLPCQWALRAAPPFLPVWVAYTRDAVRLIGPDGKLVARPLEPPFAGGYREGILESRGSLTNSGYEVPLQFEYRKYRPAPGARKDSDLWEIVLVRGIARELLVSGSDGVVLTEPYKMHVADQRGAPGPFAMYPITNRHVPAVDDPRVLHSRAQMAKVAARMDALAGRHNTRRRAALVLLTLAVLALSVLIWASAWRSRLRGPAANSGAGRQGGPGRAN